MTSSTRSARTLAALLVVQLAGLIAPFAMLHPMVRSGFLATAAPYGGQVRVAVGLLIANALLTIGISLLVRRMLTPGKARAGLVLLAASVIWLALQAVDGAYLLSMLSMSERFAASGGQDDLLRAAGDALRSTRLGVHYATLVTIEIWMFTLYTALLRARLVPRWLALFGLVTVVMHFAGVVVPFFVGRPSVLILAMSMGVSQLTLALWLAIKGAPAPRPAGA